MAEVLCGINVSSKTLQVRVGARGFEAEFASSPSGVLDLAEFCSRHGVTLAVMEAIGGYERQVHVLLSAAGIACALVNPFQVRRFAQAMGVLEKTGPAGRGGDRHLRSRPWRSRATSSLRSRADPAGTGAPAAAGDRVVHLPEEPEAAGHRPARARPDRRPAGSARLADPRLEQSIAAQIEDDPLWAVLDKALRGIKGVASRTVARIVADLPEIGTVSGKRIGKLVGLAPLAADSGNHRGKRHIRGERSSVRAILYFITTVVERYQPDFRQFAERLCNAGKPPKVVRVALAHKLLIQLNAKARDARLTLQTA